MNHYRSEIIERVIVDLSCTAEAAAIVGPAEPLLRRVTDRHLPKLFFERLYVYAEPWGSLVRGAVDVIAQRIGYPHSVDHGSLYPFEMWLADRELETINYELDNDKRYALDQAYYAVREARKQRYESPGAYAVVLACAFDSETRARLAGWVQHAVSLAR